MRIFIPTRGRLDKQYTWDILSNEAKDLTLLVCPPEEVEEHQRRGRNAIARPVTGINNVRQWIMEEFKDPQTVMLDDDLKLFLREFPEHYSLVRVWKRNADKLFQHLIKPLDEGYIQAGLSPRQQNQVHFPYRYIHNTRVNAVHAINAPKLLDLGIKYNAVEIMEDYHVTLSLFEAGIPNKIFVAGAWDQREPSGSPGGIADFRTKEVQAAGAHKLAELHPKFVKVVNKVAKTGWADGKERTDVTIAWKQAFKSSGQPTPEDI